MESMYQWLSYTIGIFEYFHDSQAAIPFLKNNGVNEVSAIIFEKGRWDP